MKESPNETFHPYHLCRPETPLTSAMYDRNFTGLSVFLS